MKQIFIDTNVIIDFLLEREGATEAECILQLGENHEVNLVVSFLTMANVAYIIKKGHTKEEVNEILSELCNVLHTLSMDEKQLKCTLQQPSIDFEDNLQYQCAISHGCDIIITRNIKHFPFRDIPIMTPVDYLQTK